MEVFLAILFSILCTCGVLYMLSYADYLASQYQRARLRLNGNPSTRLSLVQSFGFPWQIMQWIIAGTCIFIISMLLGLINVWLLVVLALAGFVILGILLWQDMQEVNRLRASMPEPENVVIEAFPSQEIAHLYGLHGEYKGQLLVCSPETLIGRGKHSDIRLRKTDVSGKHARIVYAQGQWYIQDMSRWGTFVDGISVKAQVLKPGNKIRISNSEFEFRTE
jgi:hypothetical protein